MPGWPSPFLPGISNDRPLPSGRIRISALLHSFSSGSAHKYTRLSSGNIRHISPVPEIKAKLFASRNTYCPNSWSNNTVHNKTWHWLPEACLFAAWTVPVTVSYNQTLSVVEHSLAPTQRANPVKAFFLSLQRRI